jgi:hypothetical protein
LAYFFAWLLPKGRYGVFTGGFHVTVNRPPMPITPFRAPLVALFDYQTGLPDTQAVGFMGFRFCPETHPLPDSLPACFP